MKRDKIYKITDLNFFKNQNQNQKVDENENEILEYHFLEWILDQY